MNSPAQARGLLPLFGISVDLYAGTKLFDLAEEALNDAQSTREARRAMKRQNTKSRKMDDEEEEDQGRAAEQGGKRESRLKKGDTEAEVTLARGREVAARVEKFDGPAIEPIELLNIRIRVEILSEFRKFCQNSSEIQKFEDLSTFSKLFIEILRNSH